MVGRDSERARRRAPGPRLVPADLERLRYACDRKKVVLDRSLLGSGSLTWRINRESVVLLGGGRALLMQVAHPLVAAGVARHSRFREEPLQRLWRTLELMLTVTFANASEAIDAVRSIERVHARVHGTLKKAVGPFSRGARYDANDPALLFWVYATLVDTSLLVYERFVASLSAEDKLAYYRESKIGARLFGIPEEMIPRALPEFRAYVSDMLRGPTLAVGPAAREIAASILRPPLPPGVQHLFRAANFITVDLLPPPLRERYGLASGLGGAFATQALATSARWLLPLVPGMVRFLPHARGAA